MHIMEPMEIYAQRKARFDAARKFEDVDRVPNLSNFYTWKVFDCGVDLELATTELDEMRKVQIEFHERYDFDAYFDSFGNRNDFKLQNLVGGGNHRIDNETGSIYIEDHQLMEEDEYGEFMADPMKFMWEKAFRRYAPNLTINMYRAAMGEFLKWGGYSAEMPQYFMMTYGVLPFPPAVLPPFEQVLTTYRGIKGASLDIRKRPDEVQALCDMLYASVKSNIDKNATAADEAGARSVNNANTLGQASLGAFDALLTSLSVALMAHTILSPKQFERFYWKYLKDICDTLIDSDKSLFMYIEGSLAHLTDFFRDLPKGFAIMHLEQDDVREFRKILPNICLAGGMPTTLLGGKVPGGSTPKDCAEYAKALIEDMGNGFILSQDKMVSYKNDCRRDNLLAVCEYVRTYKQ